VLKVYILFRSLVNLNKILVFLQHKPFLGAQIVQLPFYYLLKEKYPSAHITAVGTEGSGEFLNRYGMIDELHVVDDQKTSLNDTVKKLKGEKFDLCFQQRRHSFRFVVTSRRLCRNIIGFKNEYLNIFQKESYLFDKKRYIAHNYLSMIGGKLEDYLKFRSFERKEHICIIPAGSNDIKKYPLDMYLKAAEELSRDHEVRFILGPDMQKEAEALKDTGFAMDIDLPLNRLEERVASSKLVITNDCGPGHFAHIHDTPRISLFAIRRYTHEWFYPTSNSELLLPAEDGDISEIPVNNLLDKTRRFLYNT